MVAEQTEASLSAASSEFLRLAAEVARVEEVINVKANRPKKTLLRARTVRAIRARRARASALLSSPAPSMAQLAQVEALKVEADRLLAADKKAHWVSFVSRGAALRASNPKKYWAFLKAACACSPRMDAQTLDPVTNAQGEVVFVPADILAAWSEYYRGLGEDTHKMNMSQWKQSLNLPTHPALPINHKLTWEELCAAMSSSDGFKSAGPSGVQLGFFQCAVDVANGDGVFPTIPSTPLGRIILAIAQAMWVKEVIPKELCMALLVSIHKKGDKADMSNYRGISLCETLLKIVSSVLSLRLQVALDASDHGLVKEQAGFRRGEEFASHSAALREICQRCKNNNKQILLVFLDFSKAFDMVPHSCLMYKLHSMGVQGTALHFIQALYAHPTCCVSLPGGLRGDPIPVGRGVRQGCPLSPILFDIFINDLLVKCSGLSIPSLKEKIPGLLFADDAITMGNSGTSMQTSLDTVGAWATRHHMSFNITKCGAMLVNGLSSGADYLAVVGLFLQGKPVPVVDSYVYLGLPFFPSLDLKEVVTARKNKCLSIVNSSTKFLSNASIPFMAKLDFLRSVIHPKLSFGGEILGFNNTLTSPLDSLFTKCIRLTFCGWGAPCAPVILHETGILSISNTCSVMRARAITKYRNVRSVISCLVSQPMTSRCSTWVSGSTKGLKKALKGIDIPDNASPKVVCAALKKKLSVSFPAGSQSGLIRYKKCMFSTSKSYLSTFFKHYSRFSSVELGVMGLFSCRGGNFFTAYNMARAGFIPEMFLSCCPFCMRKKVKGESLNHMFLSCSAWSVERVSFLQPLLALIPGAHSRTRTVTILLGGSDALINLGPKWFNGVDALFINVARFLAAIRPRRKECLKAPNLSQGAARMAPVLPGNGG